MRPDDRSAAAAPVHYPKMHRHCAACLWRVWRWWERERERGSSDWINRILSMLVVAGKVWRVARELFKCKRAAARNAKGPTEQKQTRARTLRHRSLRTPPTLVNVHPRHYRDRYTRRVSADTHPLQHLVTKTRPESIANAKDYYGTTLLS